MSARILTAEEEQTARMVAEDFSRGEVSASVYRGAMAMVFASHEALRSRVAELEKALAVKQEECAKVAENHWGDSSLDIAEAIRAMGAK